MSKEFKFLQGYKEVGVIYYLPTYTPSTYATDMTISTSGGYGTTTTHTTYIPTTYTTHNPLIHNSFGTITTGGHFAATGTLTTSSTGIGYSSSSLSLL